MTTETSPINACTGMAPADIAATLNISDLRGKQIFHWLHKKRIFELEAMSDLPGELRALPSQKRPMTALKIVARQASEKTGTLKILFELEDGETIESVLLRHGTHVTFCLSSQVGCALKCSFCATGLAGFRRQLSIAEIVEQALRLAHEAHLDEGVTPNIVFMGMGEPFLNYDAVMTSIRLLMHPAGMGIGARKIVVSTVGDVPGILQFTEEEWQVRLSISLHAADDDLRNDLVPLNRRYPLAVLRDALVQYQQRRARQITIEWTLLQGVNDTGEQARALAVFLKGLDVVVNLIPWNPVAELSFQPSSSRHITAFTQALDNAGVKATVRKERGDDIDAACGQLRALRAR